jgi:hypothetical protein
MNKEEIYDARISPLMSEITRLCKENGIAMFASFLLSPDNDDDGLKCTTHLPAENGKFSREYKRCVDIVYAGSIR